MTGGFIVLEGIDGAGTTTISKMLFDKMAGKKINVHLTKEPTDFSIGRLIRSYLKNKQYIDEKSMALLFAADRIMHITEPETGIKSYLDKNYFVITDRYFLSSMAYQSVKVDIDFIKLVNKYIINPDLTILLDIEPEKSLLRKKGNKEKYEDLNFLSRVRQSYLDFACQYQDAHNVKIINSNMMLDEVFKKACTYISDCFNIKL